MRTTMFLSGTLVAIMTMTAPGAQETTSNSTDKISSELDQLVDMAELELLSDAAKSLLKEDAKEEDDSNTSFQTQESNFDSMPGMNMGGFGGFGGGMPPMGGGMGGFGGMPVGDMGGFGGMPMGGFGGFGGMPAGEMGSFGGGMPPMGGGMGGGMPDFGAMFGGGMGGFGGMPMGGFPMMGGFGGMGGFPGMGGASVATSALDQPVADAASDPGTAKVTTAALNLQWSQRIQEKKEQAEKEGKDIQLVLVGDSITHFWENPSRGFLSGGQDAYKELSKYHPLNLGFAGDRTEHTLHVIKDAGIFKLIEPKYVTLMIGTNNFGTHEAEVAGTAEGIRQCVLAIKEQAPKAKILLYGIFPRGDGLGDKCATTNAIIKDFADGKTVFYEDLTPKFTDEKGNLIHGVMNSDRLHPAEKGYQIWLDSIKAFIADCESPLGKTVLGAEEDFGYQLVTTPQLSQNYVQRIQEKTAQAEKEGKDIKFVMVGDSITHFWEQAGSEVYNANYAKYHPLNLGFAGDRTQNILYVIEKTDIFSKIDPQLVMLLIGVNNFGWNQGGPIATADGIRLCVRALKKKAPNAKILLLGIFPSGNTPNDQNRAKISATNEIIRKFADNETIFYEDLGPKFLTKDGILERDIMADFLHPTAKGYQIWADAIRPYVEKYCK